MRTSFGSPGRLFIIVLAACVAVVGCSPFATRGTMPPPGPDGAVAASTAPDFLAVAAPEGGIAGYARKGDVLGHSDEAFPVFGDDLQTVIGQMVPGKGFVPIGVDPADAPTFAVGVAPSGEPAIGAQRQVVLYVRNDTTSDAWVGVFVGDVSKDSSGFPGRNMGVGCYVMPIGSRLVLLDRSPQKSGVSELRQVYLREQGGEPPSIWIAIRDDGQVDQGFGVPAWWGEPQAC